MKIVFRPVNATNQDIIDRNKAASVRLALPIVGTCGAEIKPPLAIVGGGPFLPQYRDELANWDGEIYAINGAFRWCWEHGIKTGFYSIDASEQIVADAQGAQCAILGDICDPGAFAAIDGPVEVFPIGEIPCGSTTASAAPMIASMRGNRSVTLFGCESSFTGRVHAYDWTEENTGRVLVTCGGAEYLTTPQLIMQAEYLADIARNVPRYVMVAGDGFLPALIKHGDYDVLKVSRDIAGSLANGNA